MVIELIASIEFFSLEKSYSCTMLLHHDPCRAWCLISRASPEHLSLPFMINAYSLMLLDPISTASLYPGFIISNILFTEMRRKQTTHDAFIMFAPNSSRGPIPCSWVQQWRWLLARFMYSYILFQVQKTKEDLEL